MEQNDVWRMPGHQAEDISPSLKSPFVDPAVTALQSIAEGIFLRVLQHVDNQITGLRMENDSLNRKLAELSARVDRNMQQVRMTEEIGEEIDNRITQFADYDLMSKLDFGDSAFVDAVKDIVEDFKFDISVRR